MNKEIKKIYDNLLGEISGGVFKPGDVIPKEVDLAKKFGTNRMNARRAVSALAEHNIVVRRKRIGSTVSPHLDYAKLKKLLKEANRSIHVLYSMTPHWIHWNETSFTALEDVVGAKGYSVSYSNIPTGNERSDYKKLLHGISEAGTSALVIFPDTEDSDFICSNSDLLLDFQMPIFMLNRSGQPMLLDMVSFVSADPFGDGIFVGALLKKNDFRNILMLREASGDSFWGDKRYEGLKAGIMRDQSHSIHLSQVTWCKDNINEIVETIKQANGNIVVVGINNEYSAALITLCRQNKLKIPEDYQLITFDDNPLYRSFNLTSMGMPMKEIGDLFGYMICDNSWAKNYKGKISVKVNSKLIIRETLSLKIT